MHKYYILKGFILCILLGVQAYAQTPISVEEKENINKVDKLEVDMKELKLFWEKQPKKELNIIKCVGFGCCVWKSGDLKECKLYNDNNNSYSSPLMMAPWGTIETKCSKTCCCTWINDNLVRCVGNCGPATGGNKLIY